MPVWDRAKVRQDRAAILAAALAQLVAGAGASDKFKKIPHA